MYKIKGNTPFQGLQYIFIHISQGFTLGYTNTPFQGFYRLSQMRQAFYPTP